MMAAVMAMSGVRVEMIATEQSARGSALAPATTSSAKARTSVGLMKVSLLSKRLIHRKMLFPLVLLKLSQGAVETLGVNSVRRDTGSCSQRGYSNMTH